MTLVAQRSAAWRADRAGRITASRFVDVMASGRGGKASSARTAYARELVFERLAKSPTHEVKSRSLEWGTDIERFALEAYEVESGNLVEACEFRVHPVHTFIGASPDGHVAPNGGIEMKCPMDEAVHVSTWLDGMPDEHVPQVQGVMWVCGWAWMDFISYDPRQAEEFRLYVQRVPRDEKYIAVMVEKLLSFEYDVNAMVDQVRQRAA